MPLHVPPTTQPVTVTPRGDPISLVDRYSGTDTTYKTVVSWTVTAGKTGELKEVSMMSDTYAATHFKLTIAGEEQFKDKIIGAPLTLPFPQNELEAGDIVILEVKRTGAGAAITVDGSITGREI